MNLSHLVSGLKSEKYFFHSVPVLSLKIQAASTRKMISLQGLRFRVLHPQDHLPSGHMLGFIYQPIYRVNKNLECRGSPPCRQTRYHPRVTISWALGPQLKRRSKTERFGIKFPHN